jgi:hypothetical protein
MNIFLFTLPGFFRRNLKETSTGGREGEREGGRERPQQQREAIGPHNAEEMTRGNPFPEYLFLHKLYYLQPAYGKMTRI